MSSPNAKFPASVWNGLSANVSRPDRNVYHAPNADDWDQAVSEVVALQLEINRAANSLATAVDGATVTFDVSLSAKHAVTLGGSRTLAVTGDKVGQTFTLVLKQDATGSRLVTWFPGILWPGGTVPALTTTAGKRDVFAFLVTAPGEYLGFVTGQGL